MEEAMLQKSASSIRNSTQFAKMLLRKSLTNQLIDKVHVTMRQVVQNLVNQPEFEAIICEYAKHHHDFHHNVSAPWLLLILLCRSSIPAGCMLNYVSASVILIIVVFYVLVWTSEL